MSNSLPLQFLDSYLMEQYELVQKQRRSKFTGEDDE